MRRTRIKICGVRDAETAKAAVQAGVDALGLVFVPRSPRAVTIEQARAVIDTLPAFVDAVGLFVDTPEDEILSVAGKLGLRTVQLHGSETPQQVAGLAPLRVIKALGFEPRQASSVIAPWRGHVGNLAAVLWDAPPPPDVSGEQALPGGNATQLDWEALAAMSHGGMLAGLPPTVLAGGLTPMNVGQAISQVHPFAVDVSSGVESSRGVKDAALIRQFIASVQRADNKDRV